MAIIAPPSMGVEKIATLVHKTLAEINSEAMYGLHSRSQNIETQVVRSGQTIEQLQTQVANSNAHAKRMEDNNDLLRQSLKELMKNFEAYKKDVEREHPLNPLQRSILAAVLHRESATGRRATT